MATLFTFNEVTIVADNGITEFGFAVKDGEVFVAARRSGDPRRFNAASLDIPQALADSIAAFVTDTLAARAQAQAEAEAEVAQAQAPDAPTPDDNPGTVL